MSASALEWAQLLADLVSSLVGQEIQFINIQINTYKWRLCVYGA